MPTYLEECIAQAIKAVIEDFGAIWVVERNLSGRELVLY